MSKAKVNEVKEKAYILRCDMDLWRRLERVSKDEPMSVTIRKALESYVNVKRGAAKRRSEKKRAERIGVLEVPK